MDGEKKKTGPKRKYPYCKGCDHPAYAHSKKNWKCLYVFCKCEELKS